MNQEKKIKEIKVDELVDKYSKLMYHIAFNYCKNRADAEDIIQDVFYKYINKKPDFTDEDHERAWFLRVTINTSKDYTKSFWFKKTEGLNKDISFVNEKEKYIWELVQILPIKDRIVIQLYYQEGYLIKEISSILGIRESTICSRLERARKKLRKLCEEA